MGKNSIEMDGVVMEALPNGTFRVEIETKEGAHSVLAHLSGRMRKNNIKVLLGDKVRVEISPYDLTRGRVVYRYKV